MFFINVILLFEVFSLMNAVYVENIKQTALPKETTAPDNRQTSLLRAADGFGQYQVKSFSKMNHNDFVVSLVWKKMS